MPHPIAAALQPSLPAGLRILVGVDTVDVNALSASLKTFGVRFEARIFTAGELSDARAVQGGYEERLAVRFAAKEAAIKAFGWTQRGINWRDIEVVRTPSGRPALQLHGTAQQALGELGDCTIELSLSHDGNQACAVVAGLLSTSESDHEPSH